MKILCKLFGHKHPVCPNGCNSHGFCGRCGMFYEDGKWYDTWQDSKKKGTDEP